MLIFGKPAMSLLARVRYHLSHGSFTSHIHSPLVLSPLTGHFSQPARLDDEQEEIKIDQRDSKLYRVGFKGSFKKGVSKEEAEKIIGKMKVVGAIVVME
ncbi:hypothetical protein CASFOL_039107 [Castilleja foliolosa]|uniref:Uncharacterized protein n=1 Tax=Castilleja foliolosa TaxID=1961234 RepID=A0ABD3BHL5_9LAMI